MDYIVQTLVTFNVGTSHEQCLSYHESKFSFNQMLVQVNNKWAVIIMKHKKRKIL